MEFMEICILLPNSNGELIDPDIGRSSTKVSVSIMAQGFSYIESSSRG
jgi:hypothetical protein